MVFIAGVVCAQQSIGTTDLTQSFILRPSVLAMGGAYRAIATSNAAIQLNPAGLAQREGKAGISGDYAYNGRTDSSMWSVSAYDASTLPGGAMGISYDRDTPTYAGVSASVQQLTLAYGQKLPYGLYIGSSVKGYLSGFSSTGQGSPDGFDTDIGFLIKSIPHLSLGATLQNVFQGSRFEEFPMLLSGAASLELMPYGRIAVDIVKNLNTPATNSVNTYMGAEVRMAEGVYARGGFGIDQINDNHFYSLGGALEGPKVSLSFVYSRRLNPSSDVFAGNIEMFF